MCTTSRKAEGDILNYHKNGFQVVIMNQQQEILLEKYGEKCLYFDTTYNVTRANYKMTLLLVLNELK